MSHAHRPSLLHNPNSLSSSSNPSTTNPTLTTRITQKRAELENLRALRDLSADLASQMAVLESKLEMLSGGTEGVAEVLRNWRGVLGILGMVGGEMRGLSGAAGGADTSTGENGDGNVREGVLPGTLVRIPVDVNQDGGGGTEKGNETG